MRLHTSPASPFSRKARVIAHELNLPLEEVQLSFPLEDSYRRVNPLAQVPALVLDDGSVLIDSVVICEYLNTKGGGKFYPGTSIWRDNTGRWKALGLQALADGLCDAAIGIMREKRREHPDAAVVARHLATVNAVLDVLERSRFAEQPTIGEIATGCALGYVDFRLTDLDWRATRPKLTAWYAKISQYPAMLATAPHA
jgi:glutathione S-transferase